MRATWWQALPERYRLEARELARWVELSGGTFQVQSTTEGGMTVGILPDELLYRAGEVWLRLGQRWDPLNPYEFKTTP